MISNLRYWFLIVLIILVYIAGMSVTLLENDSAQFAVMAMRMVQENDFLSLFKGPNEYLDKPHMHYWLAALSFKIFGIYDWAYRIPGLLATLLAAYSCYGLGKLLYNKQVGKLSALVFMTAQTIVLSVIDVRTDAVLTGFVIFSIWQLTYYIETKKVSAIILGAIGAGLAFSTKGQIALVVVGLPLICHMAYTKKFVAFKSWKVLLALVVFGITIVPMLYAYYHQFDMHPEKIIRGRSNRSGILFIFWEQSFERLSGKGIGKNSSDYFFFFHTFLWVFIPWTFIAILGIRHRLMGFFKSILGSQVEVLTLGGIISIFLLISFAQFKLPHYLNVIMPLFSVLTASFIYELYLAKSKKTANFLSWMQYLILAIVFIASVLICFFVFKIDTSSYYLLMFLSLMIAVYYTMKTEEKFVRMITVSVCASLLLNAILNLHFYPQLLSYQGGSSMAKVIKENAIPVGNIVKIDSMHTWSLDFYNRKPVTITTLEEIKEAGKIWVYVDEKGLSILRNNAIFWEEQFSVKQFRITRLQGKFLNPKTRDKVLNDRYLVHIN